MQYLLKMKNKIYNKCKDSLLDVPFEIRDGDILISYKQAEKVLKEAIYYCFEIQKQPTRNFWDEEYDEC